jgi:hypothetical protein
MLTFRAALRRALEWLGFEGAAAPCAATELPPNLIEPLVAPRYGIDGWTYQGTVLEDRFPADIEAELAALTHAVCAGLATPWGYEESARLLERHGAYAQAYAVVMAYVDAGAIPDSPLMKRRTRLAAAVLSQAGERRRETPGS